MGTEKELELQIVLDKDINVGSGKHSLACYHVGSKTVKANAARIWDDVGKFTRHIFNKTDDEKLPVFKDMQETTFITQFSDALQHEYLHAEIISISLDANLEFGHMFRTKNEYIVRRMLDENMGPWTLTAYLIEDVIEYQHVIIAKKVMRQMKVLRALSIVMLALYLLMIFRGVFK